MSPDSHTHILEQHLAKAFWTRSHRGFKNVTWVYCENTSVQLSNSWSSNVCQLSSYCDKSVILLGEWWHFSKCCSWIWVSKIYQFDEIAGSIMSISIILFLLFSKLLHRTTLFSHLCTTHTDAFVWANHLHLNRKSVIYIRWSEYAAIEVSYWCVLYNLHCLMQL